ncbi:hypothetical protein [Vibrio phage LP.2]|nr:hypothetical protein [Vibrio phage LP.2]
MTDAQEYLSYLTQQTLIVYVPNWPKTESECLNIQLPYGVFWYRLDGEYVASDGKSFVKNRAAMESTSEILFDCLSPSEEFRQYLRNNNRKVEF